MSAPDSVAPDGPPVIESVALGALVLAVGDLVTAQAAGDGSAVATAAPKVAAAQRTVATLAGIGLGGQYHPVGKARAAVMVRDAVALARHTMARLRVWLSTTHAARGDDVRVLTAWEPTVAMPAAVYARLPAVLALGAGAVSRRTGVVANAAGESWLVGDVEACTEFLSALVYLHCLVVNDLIVLATFPWSDVIEIRHTADGILTAHDTGETEGK